jgi:translation initiation factor 2 beta subunit (eIF-2beta)/eIF-5
VLESIHQIEITNDRYFDYFSIQDLCKVVEYFIEYDSEFKDVNCVYQPKFKISEIVKKFCDFHSFNIDIKVSSSSDKNYTGNATRLSALGINLDGIENGLKNYKKGLK